MIVYGHVLTPRLVGIIHASVDGAKHLSRVCGHGPLFRPRCLAFLSVEAHREWADSAGLMLSDLPRRRSQLGFRHSATLSPASIQIFFSFDAKQCRDSALQDQILSHCLVFLAFASRGWGFTCRPTGIPVAGIPAVSLPAQRRFRLLGMVTHPPGVVRHPDGKVTISSTPELLCSSLHLRRPCTRRLGLRARDWSSALSCF